MRLFQFKNLSFLVVALLLLTFLPLNEGLCEAREGEQENNLMHNDEIVDPVINPATKYCTDSGYVWEKKMTDEGEIGICVMPSGEKLEEWSFATGRTGEEWSYCEKKGLKLKIISDVEKCRNVLSEECAVCVLDDGTYAEVTKLLKTDIINNIAPEKEKETKIVALMLLFGIIILVIIFAYWLLTKKDDEGDNKDYSKDIEY
jgi:putative hemolysin